METEETGTKPRADETQTLSRPAEDQMTAAQKNGATEERARVTTILQVNKYCHLKASFAEKHILAGTDVNMFRKLAIEEEFIQNPDGCRPIRVNVNMVSDEQEVRRELMTASLYGLMDPKQKTGDRDNPFLGLSMRQIAEESVRLQHGYRTPPPNDKMVTLAMQTTADFAAVLESVARKQLLAMYAYAAPTYRIWCKRSTTPDFKTMTRVRLGETPEFLKVPEGAQIPVSPMTDSKESYAIYTYGRAVSFTRQMLINDDLGAFNDLIGQFGVQAARLENKIVYAILNTNAAMADTIALFYATTHVNLGTGVIGNAALDAMFTSFGIQKGIDGKTVLNLIPRYLIVPKAKEATARTALMAIGPNVKASDQNWFAGRLEPIADAELDGTSTAVWYAACDPTFAPGIEYCHLEGQDGPQFIRKDNEQGILGIQFYSFIDFGAKAVDWRPLYKSSGA